jgi:hypothetical protein
MGGIFLRKVVVPLVAAVFLLVAVLVLLGDGAASVYADPDIIYVSLDCSAAPSRCTTLQNAVGAASSGDEIHIAGGTYTGEANDKEVLRIIHLDKILTLRGGYSNDFTVRDSNLYPTILDGEGERRGLYVGPGVTVTLDGLQVINGNAEGLGGEGDHNVDDVGGGLYADQTNLTVQNCRFSDNVADDGGGLYLHDSTVTISDTSICSNTAHFDSGGDFGGGEGGGLFLSSGDLTVHGSTFSGNVAESMGGGAALYGTEMTLTDNRVYSNAAPSGGSGWLVSGWPVSLHRNWFYHNGSASGLFLRNSSADLVNNVFIGNWPGGVGLSGVEARFRHTTIADNADFGLSASSSGQLFSDVVLTNTIVSGNEVGVQAYYGGAITLTATLWDNVTNTMEKWDGHIFVGDGSYTGDPAFADVASGDVHIRPASAAVGRGVPVQVSDDLDGDPRPHGAMPDLGADEYHPEPVDGVIIEGPAVGLTDVRTSFTAIVTPTTAMVPITYTWQATGQASKTRVISEPSDTIAFTWGVTSTETVTVTVDNDYGGVVNDVHNLEVHPVRGHLYLPLVVRGNW